MFNSTIIVPMIITIVLAVASFVVPFGIMLFITRKTETGMWGSFGLGALGYFWSQYLLTLPVLLVLTQFKWFNTIYTNDSYYVWYMLVTAVLLSVLGALARLWCIVLMNKRTPSLYRAMCSGVGFAAIKACGVIMSYVSYVQYVKVINASGTTALKEQLKNSSKALTDEAVDNLINEIISASNFDILMEGINVVFLTLVEIGLIVIVYEGFVRNKKWIATLISAGVNIVFTFIAMIIPALASDKMGHIMSEEASVVKYDFYMLICAIIAGWIIVGAIRRYNEAKKNGSYAKLAYFEKSEEDKIKDLL